jgi:hypothetical protein
MVHAPSTEYPPWPLIIEPGNTFTPRRIQTMPERDNNVPTMPRILTSTLLATDFSQET